MNTKEREVKEAKMWREAKAGKSVEGGCAE